MINPPLPEPWDGRELLTSALERHGMRAAFLNAVNGRKRDEAKRILCKVGADDIVDVVGAADELIRECEASLGIISATPIPEATAEATPE